MNGLDQQVQRLVTASHQLNQAPDQSSQAVTEIESLLRDRAPDADWSAAHYAAQAAKACLAQGDETRAGTLLQLGLQFSPNNSQLHYLARIVSRRQNRSWKEARSF